MILLLNRAESNIMINSQGLNASGTPLNDEYNEEITIPFQKSRLPDSIREKRRKALREGIWTQDEEIDYIHKLPYKEIQIAREKEWKYIESQTQYPEIIFLDLSRYYKNHPSQIEKILPKLSDSIIKRIQLNLEREKEATAEYIKKYGMPESKIIEKIPESIQIGQPFTNFTGITPDGKQISLSEVVKNNKLVLIDFWASWCGPCMQEMHLLAEIYKQYQDKGLQIIGISSDRNHQQWTAAIQKKNMAWLQIRSIEEDYIQDIYSIKFLPSTILINHNGIIIARKLRGEELLQKIKEILN